jgi:hypothetical protein
MRAGGPGCPITRRPGGTGNPRDDEGPPITRVGRSHRVSAQVTGSYRRQQLTDPEPDVEARAMGTWTAGTPLRRGAQAGRQGSSDPRDSAALPTEARVPLI